MTIKVRMQRKEYRIKIADSATVSDLYEGIAAEAKIPKKQIRLIHNGQKLNSESIPLAEKKVDLSLTSYRNRVIIEKK